MNEEELENVSHKNQTRAHRESTDEAMLDEVHAASDAAAAEGAAAEEVDPGASLQLQLREAQEKALRTQAELENFRKLRSSRTRRRT